MCELLNIISLIIIYFKQIKPIYLIFSKFNSVKKNIFNIII